MKRFILTLIFITAVTFVYAQSKPEFEGLERFFIQPKSYVIGYTSTPPVIDGEIDDQVWKAAVWTDEFRDIEGELSDRPLPYYETRAKMLWDKNYLYIAAQLEDKHVWANLAKHDEIVYNDNDFEVFIDPKNCGHRYFELEINALNTIFDLFLIRPYHAGNGLLISWDIKDLKHAVKINGTLNDPSDEDKGWTVELAIPFKSIDATPQDSSIWRLGFSRVEWDTEISDRKYVKKKDAAGKNLPENNWVWSPQGKIDMHLPERWGYIQFSTIEVSSKLPEFKLPYSELQRQYLWLIYYKQQQYTKNNAKYAKSLDDLELKSLVQIAGKTNVLSLEATSYQFTATISDIENDYIILINNEGLVTVKKNTILAFVCNRNSGIHLIFDEKVNRVREAGIRGLRGKPHCRQAKARSANIFVAMCVDARKWHAHNIRSGVAATFFDRQGDNMLRKTGDCGSPLRSVRNDRDRPIVPNTSNINLKNLLPMIHP
jgi:hypothetical protein